MFNGYDEPSEDGREELVSLYEKLVKEQNSPFFDSDQYEQITEFYLQNDQIAKAKAVAEMAIKQYPFCTGLLLHLAHIRIYDNRIQDALEIADKIKLLEPLNPDVFVVLGNAYDEMGQYGKAIEQYKKALDVESEKDEIYVYMAYCYENWDRYEKAIDVLKKAINHNPNNEQALSELAFCCDFSDKTEGIVDFLNQLIDENPYSFMAWYCLGTIYYKEDELEDAAKCFDFAGIINEKYIPAHLNLGNIHYMQDEYDKAIDSFKKILEVSKDDIFALCYIANCYKAMGGSLRKSREFYKKALQVDNAFADAWHGLGTTYQLDDNHQMAIDYFKKAIDHDKDDSNYWFCMAESYHELDNFEDAIECYTKALELENNNPLIVRGFSLFLCDYEMYKEAKEIINETLSTHFEDIELHLIMAGVLLHLEVAHEAVFHLAEAKDLDPKAGEAFVELFPEFAGHYLVQEIFNL